jgi:hypothetical protein
MTESEETPEVRDDSEFVLRFVNKKSTERVLELVDEIKASFRQPELEVDTAPAECLRKIEEHPELLFSSPQILDIKPDPRPPPPTPRFAALKGFLFPFNPASIPKQKTKLDDASEEVRHDFLTESRLEHERLLWSFQDRLIRHLCATDEQFQREPFQVATAQLAKEQTLPIHLVAKRKNPESIQQRYNMLLKKSQKKALAVLEGQKRDAKMIRDAKQFEINFAKLQKNEPISLNDKFFELPVVCPFPFLFDGGTKS